MRLAGASVVVGLVVGLGCGGDDDVESDFTASESEEIWTASEGVLHNVHLGADFPESAPTEYVYDCEDGGTVTMTAEYQDEGPSHVVHVFEACAEGGLVWDGDITYQDPEYGVCDGVGLGYDIVGTLTLQGDLAGSCPLDAHMECDVLSGSSCGHDL